MGFEERVPRQHAVCIASVASFALGECLLNSFQVFSLKHVPYQALLISSWYQQTTVSEQDVDHFSLHQPGRL